MKIKIKLLYFSVFCLFLFGSLSVCAGEDFESWKTEFYETAKKEGVSDAVLEKYVPKMTLLNRVIELDTKKPEYVLNFYDYTKARVTDYRVVNGKKMMKKYPTWLRKISQKYGVDAHYLIALWGMETNYGSFKGKTNILDALATLAYHPRRRNFFTKELIAYLKIIQNEPSVAPMIGSWDGGFGHFQFMPTTFQSYAVDGDNNGRRNIVNNIPDALSSAANYLSKMGWQRNEPWGRAVLLPDNPDWDKIHQYKQLSVANWNKLGIRPKGLKKFPENELKIQAELRMPMGMSGPIFLIYPNFKVIQKWNRLELNAFSTGLLADTLIDLDSFLSYPTDFRPFKTKTIIQMQEKLKEKGYYTGSADGSIGEKTRIAIRLFQRDNRLHQDGYPNSVLLNKLECY